MGLYIYGMQTTPQLTDLARRIAAAGELSRTPFVPGVGETWAAQLGSLYVILDSLAFEVRLSESRDIRQTGLEGLAFTTEAARTWIVLEGPEARDARARVLLRCAAAGLFMAPGCGWDLDRFQSELLEPLILEVA